MGFIANLISFPAVQNFRKSVKDLTKLQRVYRRELFWDTVW